MLNHQLQLSLKNHKKLPELYFVYVYMLLK